MNKMIKLSLAAGAVIAMTTTASAGILDNVKMSGGTKLFYETNDNDTIFDKQNSSGQVMVNLRATGNLAENIRFNVENTTATTLGLEHTLVSNVRTGGSLDTQNYNGIANIEATFDNTIIKFGRQELATPLCFTEKWNAHKNTFEAGLIVNTGLIPNSTLVLADVKSTNSGGGFGLSYDGEFNTKLDANMVGLLSKVGTVDAKAFYYDFSSGATALWTEGSVKTNGLKVRVIGATIDPTTGDTGFAGGVSVTTNLNGLKVMGAFSTVTDDGVSFGNVATGGKKTYLPTAGVYTDGKHVAQSGATAVKLKVSGLQVEGVNLAAQIAISKNDMDIANGINGDATEVDFIATKSFGKIKVKSMLMFMDRDIVSAGKSVTDDSTKFRVVANYSF